MEGCHFQKAERKLPLLYTSVHICTHCNRKRSPIATEFHEVLVMIPKRTLWFQNVRILAPKQTLWLQNSSREDPPEYASAAWDHWTGRDCATGRPSRSLCLDLTSGPPSGRSSFALTPDPLSMDTDGRTAPCLNARGCGIYKGRGPAQEVPLPQRHPATGSIAP